MERVVTKKKNNNNTISIKKEEEFNIQVNHTIFDTRTRDKRFPAGMNQGSNLHFFFFSFVRLTAKGGKDCVGSEQTTKNKFIDGERIIEGN